MRDHRVRVGEHEFQVRESEHEGDAIVFLHFGGGNLLMWQPAVPFFLGSYRLVLIDLRGHGRSDRPKTGYHIDDMADDVAGVMDGLRLDRAHIVGSSLGAEVGLSLASRFPARVASLVCEGALHSESGPYGTWAGSDAEFEVYVARTMDAVRNKPDPAFPSIEALVEDSRQMFETYGWWNPHVEALVRYGASEVDGAGFAGCWRKPLTEEYLTHYLRYRFEDYYRQIDCPLLMTPDESLLQNDLASAAMRGLARLSRQARIAEIEGWIHPYGWLIDPGPMCRTVLRFLEGQE